MLADILIVAPYNGGGCEVDAIAASLPDGTHVGTIDKFQKQEAPIAINLRLALRAIVGPTGGTRRGRLDAVVVSRRRAARHAVPLQPESRQRGDIAGDV